MRISIVADIHGNFTALREVATAADQLIILGDLLDYIDYHNPHRGIISEMFGAAAAQKFAHLRKSGNFLELRTFNARLWGTLDDPAATLADLVQTRYQQVVRMLPENAIVTLGNVDMANHWQAVAGDRFPYRDGETLQLDGLTFGFVAGGARRIQISAAQRSALASPWQPLMRDAADYRAALGRIGPVDVMCTHIPPQHPLLRYDTVPGRLEMFAPGLREYIERHQPQLSLFGHVHQPLAHRARIRHTECINVGHFQRWGRPLIIDTDQIRAAIRRVAP